MGYRRLNFKTGNWYHCYSWSIDSTAAYLSSQDYERFLQSLYLCNDEVPFKRGALYLPSHERLLAIQRSSPLVSVAAYCIMPDRFHLLVRENRRSGISRYLQKLMTSYSMYINARRKRAGNIFIKPFRSELVGDDARAMRVSQFIHLDAADLFDDEWRQGKVASTARLRKNLTDYRYSSLRDYERYVRAENNILDSTVLKTFSDFPSIKEVLPEASDYLSKLTHQYNRQTRLSL